MDTVLYVLFKESKLNSLKDLSYTRYDTEIIKDLFLHLKKTKAYSC